MRALLNWLHARARVLSAEVLRQMQPGGGAQQTMAEKELVGKGMRRLILCALPGCALELPYNHA